MPSASTPAPASTTVPASSPRPLIRSAAEDRVLTALGDEVRFHLTGADTGGAQTVFSVTTPPGGGPPPHVHAHESETFHVIAGRVAFFLDGVWSEVAPGGTVFMPPGSFHTFKNIGDKPLRMLLCTSPSGFEHFFARVAEEAARPGGPDMARIVAISAEHGITYPPAPPPAG